MTNKIFWEDPHLTTLETVVESLVGNSITFQEMIFYAFSGGQEVIPAHSSTVLKAQTKSLFA